MKTWLFVAVMISASAAAEPRVVVNPLDVGNVTDAQREQLRAQFDVMLARLQGVKLAGSARMEEALGKSAATRCEVRDSCLRFLADATESLYGTYIRIDWMADQVFAVARVVRIDGVVVRRLSFTVKPKPHRTMIELSRDALAQTLRDLKLDELPATIPDDVQPQALELSPPPVPPASLEPGPPVPTSPTPIVYALPPAVMKDTPMPFRKVVGWTLVGVGGATLVAGGVVAAVAAAGTAANPHDAAGLVSPDRAAPVAMALRQADIAAVLIPTGAAVAAIGLLVVVVPSPRETELALSVAPVRDGFAVMMGGQFQ